MLSVGGTTGTPWLASSRRTWEIITGTFLCVVWVLFVSHLCFPSTFQRSLTPPYRYFSNQLDGSNGRDPVFQNIPLRMYSIGIEQVRYRQLPACHGSSTAARRQAELNSVPIKRMNGITFGAKKPLYALEYRAADMPTKALTRPSICPRCSGNARTATLIATPSAKASSRSTLPLRVTPRCGPVPVPASLVPTSVVLLEPPGSPTSQASSHASV